MTVTPQHAAPRRLRARVAEVDGRDAERAVGMLEQVIALLDLREAADPDAPAWAADLEIARLMGELEPLITRLAIAD